MAAEIPEVPTILDVGGSAVEIPSPPGFVRCDGISAAWDEATNAMIPPENRLLATFGSPEDRAALQAGESPDFSRGFSIQIQRDHESRVIGTKTFAEGRHRLRAEIEKLNTTAQAEAEKVFDEGNRKLSEELNEDRQLSASETTALGIFLDDGKSLGFSITMTAGVVTSTGSGEAKEIVSAMVVPVNGKLLSLQSIRSYLGETDKTENEKAVKTWGDAIVAANPQLEGPSPRAARGLMRSGMIGGFAALAAISLIGLLKRLTD